MEHGKTSRFHEHRPVVPHLCEVSSMVRSNAVWNTIAVDKTFYKYMDAVLVKASHAGFIMIYYSEDKASVDLPINEVVQCRQPA